MKRTKILALLGVSLLALAACNDDRNPNNGGNGGDKNQPPEEQY